MGNITVQRVPTRANPDTYGAVGNGVADDTAALQAAFASGLDIELTPGKVYLHRHVLTMNTAGTTLWGGGATLKRAAQAISTTTTTITSGVTTAITLASAASFQVGDQIVIEQGGVYDGSVVRSIISIAGNVVTVGVAFGISLSGTTNVRTGWNQVAVDADNCRVTGVTLDGNSANWSWGRWQHTCGLVQYSSSSPSYSVHGSVVLDHNKIINQYGDGASPSGYNVVFAYNDVENIQGRGISWAGNSGPSDVGSKCIYNRFYNCDIDSNVAGTDGHGNIQISSYEQDLLIHGNQIDTGITGIGSINGTDNSDVTITGNVIRNMTTYAIEGNCNSNSDYASNVLVANNRIYNSQYLYLENGGNAGNGGPSRWNISNNLFYETTILCYSAYDFRIDGNTFYSAGTSVTFVKAGYGVGNVIYGTISDNAFEGGNYAIDLGGTASSIVVVGNRCISQATAHIHISGSSNITVSKNILIGQGNAHGILLDTSGGGSGSNVLIEGNRITGQVTDSISCSWSTTSVLIRGNMIISDSNAGGSYYAINASQQLVVEGNYIDCSAGAGHGIGCFGTVTGARIIGNLVKGSGHSTLIIGSTHTNLVVLNNWFDHVMNDSGTATQSSGNTVNGGPLTGRAVLVGGTITVSNVEVRTGDSILLTHVVAGGTLGTLSIGTITQGTSFVINSNSGSDTSTVYWEIRH